MSDVCFCAYVGIKEKELVALQDGVINSLFIILQFHSTCFGCQPHPSSRVHKTVTTASGTVQIPPSIVDKLAWPATSVQRGKARLATLEGGSCTKEYEQYRRLLLQFYVFLMMGVVDTRNM